MDKKQTEEERRRQMTKLIESSKPEERRRIEIGRREGQRLRAELEELEEGD